MNFNNLFTDKKNLFIGIVLFLSIVSFFHITHFWSITNTNPFDYISGIAAELFIIAALIAIKHTNWGWVMFLIGLFIQGFGNIYSSFTNIDMSSTMFLSFVNLTKPFYSLFTDSTDNIIYARSLSVLTGLFYVVGTTTCFNTYKAILNEEAEILEDYDNVSNTTSNDDSKQSEELTLVKSDVEIIKTNFETFYRDFQILQNSFINNNEENLNLIKEMKAPKEPKIQKPKVKKSTIESDDFIKLVESTIIGFNEEPINLNKEVFDLFDDSVKIEKEETLDTQLLQTLIEQNIEEPNQILEDYNNSNIYKEPISSNPIIHKNNKWKLKDD